MFKPFLRFALPAIAIALLAGGASAQQKAPAVPAPAAPAAAPTAKPGAARPLAVLPVISPSALAAARAVIVSSGLAQSFEPVIPELMNEIYLTITRTRPELATDMSAVLDQLKPEFMAHDDEMVNNAAEIAAGEIDEPDLVKIAAFFNSPAGKKYVTSEPEMLQRMMDTTHAWAQQMSEHMMTRVREEMKKRGKQI